MCLFKVDNCSDNLVLEEFYENCLSSFWHFFTPHEGLEQTTIHKYLKRCPIIQSEYLDNVCEYFFLVSSEVVLICITKE